MKAVILAAGKGTRMGGLTDELPKPMLEVEGFPILEHIITGLREAGITEKTIRISVGIESPNDIVADMKHALDTIG